MKPFPCIGLAFPTSQTQRARTLLEPYLPHDPDLPALSAPDAAHRRLRLHLRIPSLDHLPGPIRQDCADLGGVWDTESVSLTAAQQVRLFTVVFFSKSKHIAPLRHGLPRHWRQVLSNFQPSKLMIDDAPYLSVEHYFQGQKALCSDQPALALRFRADATDGVGAAPLAAKKAGGRGAYKRVGATLDSALWEQRRQSVMQTALEARLEQDNLFRETLLSTKGMNLLHFERAGARSFWGGSLRKSDGMPQGNNRLGAMMTALRDRSQQPQQQLLEDPVVA